jgi:hypothetical protein
VTGDKGYCTVRGTHSVRKGKWFFEVLIKELPGDSAVRVGWSQKYASIQNPVGCDVFGYSIRSKKGTVFHKAKGKSYTNKVNIWPPQPVNKKTGDWTGIKNLSISLFFVYRLPRPGKLANKVLYLKILPRLDFKKEM